MPTIPLPVTTYSVRSARPAQVYGSTVSQPLSATQRTMGMVNFAAVPADATITDVVLQVAARDPAAGSRTVSVRGVTAGAVTSSINWTKHNNLTYSGVLGSDTEASVVGGRLFEISDPLLTAWAQTRPTRGLRIDGSAAMTIRGSAAADLKPVLRVTYSMAPTVPTGLSPAGGVVSQAKPDLSFAGDPSMTDLYVEIDTTGDSVADWNSGWVPAVVGNLVQPAGAPTPSAGATVQWRARVRNSLGDSAFSPWVSYVYQPLPALAITEPDVLSADGSPTLVWTVAGTQKAWRATLSHEGTLKADSGWINDAADRTWTPSGDGVPVPDEIGTFRLEVRDAYTRVGTDTVARITHQFTTTNDGAGAGMDTLDVSFTDPVVTLTATRAAIPDEIDLLRDGVPVPIWNASGEVAMKWVGTDLLDSGVYTALDYSAPLNGEHTWELRAWTNGVPSVMGSKTETLFVKTDTVWLVDPTTGEQVEILGFDGLPVVDQASEEQSVLHIPISGGAVVEPIRRRLTRTTLAGTVTGGVLNGGDVLLAKWMNNDAGHRYRLVFGKVNWSVILGDYRPAEPVWQARCSPERTAVSINWWQRLSAGPNPWYGGSY